MLLFIAKGEMFFVKKNMLRLNCFRGWYDVK